MAACRLAAKGKTMADSGYDSEVKSIQAFLSMQHPASQPVINPATLDISVEEYVASRFLKKMKSKVRRTSKNKMKKLISHIYPHLVISDEAKEKKPLLTEIVWLDF